MLSHIQCVFISFFRAADKPPRPGESSLLQLEMSQYSAARGDFGLEFDNFAESQIKDVDFEESDSSDEEEDLEDTKDEILEDGPLEDKEVVQETMRGLRFIKKLLLYFINSTDIFRPVGGRC